MQEWLAAPLANLADSTARLARERTRRLGQLSELSYALATHLAEQGEADTPRALLGAAGAALCEVGEVSATLDRVAVTRALLSEALRLFGHPVTAGELAGGPCPPTARSRTVYIRNRLADKAYTRLSSLLAFPTVAYRESFRELFDDVENGYADYAVLPLYAGGTPVASVLSLLEERSLFITATAAVPTEEDEVTFALLAREPIAHRAPTHFLFRTVSEGGVTAAEPALAAEAFGLSVLRAETAPLPYDGVRTSCRFLLTGEDFTPILAYLSLFVPSFTGYGFDTELR